jgi:cyanate permease
MYFSTNLSFTSLPVFLPTILVEIGFSGIHAQGLTAPPYLLAFFTTLASTYITDRTRQRGATIMTLATIGTVGYILLAATKPTASRYFGVFLAAGAIFPTMANILPWVLSKFMACDSTEVSNLLTT